MGFDTTGIERQGQFRHYGSCRYSHPGVMETKLNSTFIATLRKDTAVIHTDFIDHDELYPLRRDEQRREIVQAVSLTLTQDATTGLKTVLLRRVLVYRYHMLPQSPVIEQELNGTMPVVNGDMLMALLCKNLKETASKRDAEQKDETTTAPEQRPATEVQDADSEQPCARSA